MKKTIAIFLALLFVLTGTACAEINIIATIFPQYDFARVIGGDKVYVEKLLPMGADSHTYEPTPREMLKIASCDMFIYTSPLMEGWADNVISGLSGNINVVEAASGIKLDQPVDEDSHEHEGHEHSYDAHIWLDITKAIVMCENIKNALISLDPDNAQYYENNASEYINKLNELNDEYLKLAQENSLKTLYFGGRFAYSHLMSRYNFNYVSAYDSCEANTEPGAKRIIEITQDIKAKGANIIFKDEISDGRVATKIANETGAEVRVLHTLHNVDDTDTASYLSLMTQNLSLMAEAFDNEP